MCLTEDRNSSLCHSKVSWDKATKSPSLSLWKIYWQRSKLSKLGKSESDTGMYCFDHCLSWFSAEAQTRGTSSEGAKLLCPDFPREVSFPTESQLNCAAGFAAVSGGGVLAVVKQTEEDSGWGGRSFLLRYRLIREPSPLSVTPFIFLWLSETVTMMVPLLISDTADVYRRPV